MPRKIAAESDHLQACELRHPEAAARASAPRGTVRMPYVGSLHASSRGLPGCPRVGGWGVGAAARSGVWWVRARSLHARHGRSLAYRGEAHSCTSSSIRPEPGPTYAFASPRDSACACATSRANSGDRTTARTAAVDMSMSGPLAKATGPVHGSAGELPLPSAVQLRHAFLRRVRDAPAERPNPVDISVRVRHEYHSKTPA